MAAKPLCSIPDCDKPSAHRGWCKAHYHRWYNHGDPLAGSTAKGELTRFLEDTALPYQGDDCLLWPYTKDRKGYAQINRKGTRYVHRIVCEATHGKPPSPRHEAAHECGNGHLGCVNPRHLSWKTPVENQADKVTHGTHQFGIRNTQAKLTEDDVRQIRSLKGQKSLTEIGRMFGVNFVTVSNIHTGRRWAWLP